MWTEVVGDELYVWFHGQLVYKRWLRLDYGKVFDLHGISFAPKFR